MSRTAVLLAFTASALLLACPSRRVPAPPEARPPAISVPAGCEGDLSGTYLYAARPTWTYEAQDDGGTLGITVSQRYADAGASEPLDGGPRIVLQRTPEGFVGATWATVFAAQGAACEVDFPTELVGCPDGGLLLNAVEMVGVDEACRRAPVTEDTPRAEHLLVPAGAAEPEGDAGL